MILADTSVWIEFLKGHPDYTDLFSRHLDHQRIVSVEVIFGELLQGARNRKETEVLRSYWENIPKRQIDGLWIEAGAVSSEERFHQKGVGLIDAGLIVVSRKFGDLLWTLDRKLIRVAGGVEVYRP